MKKQGVPIYEDMIGRMGIRLGPPNHHGGLLCGEGAEVLLDNITYLFAKETFKRSKPKRPKLKKPKAADTLLFEQEPNEGDDKNHRSSCTFFSPREKLQKMQKNISIAL